MTITVRIVSAIRCALSVAGGHTLIATPSVAYSDAVC